MSKINEITRCEVCNNTYLKSVLDLGSHPMCDDLVEFSENRACNQYPIEILFCKVCKTSHQRYQVPKDDLFPASYHYRARFTADVIKGMENLVQSCEKMYGSLKGKLVLDIGCNDGSLLNLFKESGASTIGIEPTEACKDAQQEGHHVICDFLSPKVADKLISEYGHPDFITFTNVFAHIEDLGVVLDSLRILKHESTKLIIENHYLGSVLEGKQFDTFYHEHPRTYSYKSFCFIAKSLGLYIEAVEFPSRYGGNIRVMIGNQSNCISQEESEKIESGEENFFSDFAKLKVIIEKWKISKRQLIESIISKQGKLSAKAFPGRAAILIKLLELNEDHISNVYEKPGSLKIGHYVPGTRIPIISDDSFYAEDSKDSTILNLAWHISDEIKGYLKSRNFEGSVVDIVSKDDF